MGRGIDSNVEGILTREYFVTIANEWDHKEISCSLGKGVIQPALVLRVLLRRILDVGSRSSFPSFRKVFLFSLVCGS